MRFAQPARMRRLLRVRHAPAQVGQRCLALAEEPGQLRPHDARHPPHDECFVAREPLRLVEHAHRVAHPAIALQQRNLVRMSCPQRCDRAQVDGTLPIAELGVEALAQLVDVGGALGVPVGIGELAHQQEHERRVRRRTPVVHLLQVGQLGMVGVALDGFAGRGMHDEDGNQQRGDGAGKRHKQPMDRCHGMVSLGYFRSASYYLKCSNLQKRSQTG